MNFETSERKARKASRAERPNVLLDVDAGADRDPVVAAKQACDSPERLGRRHHWRDAWC